MTAVFVARLLQRLRQRFRKNLIRAVETQRRDRDVAVGECGEIAVFGRRVQSRATIEAEPEIRIAAAVMALLHVEEAERALALPGDADALDLVGHAGREI